MSIFLATVHVARNIVSLDSVAGLVWFSTFGFCHVFLLDFHYNGVSVRILVRYNYKRETYLIYDFNDFSFLNSLLSSTNSFAMASSSSLIGFENDPLFDMEDKIQ